MTATLVPTIKTTFSKTELIKAFIKAWYELFNYIPKKEAIGVLFSQNAIETGNSTAMWNYNVGNVKYNFNPNDPPSVKYCVLSGVWEIIDGKKVIIPPSNPGSWFRAFDSLSEGIKFHLDLLKNKRYKTAWSAIEDGNVELFCEKLKSLGYYTASVTDYIKGMNSFYNPYMKSKDYENALASLNISEPIPTAHVIEPESPINEPLPINKPDEPVSNETPLKPIVAPTEVVVNGWQGKLFSFLKNMPWIKLIEWIVKLIKK